MAYVYIPWQQLAGTSQTHMKKEFSLSFQGSPPFPLFYASSAMHHEHLSCPYMYKLCIIYTLPKIAYDIMDIVYILE
jgi:hypothetical protein